MASLLNHTRYLCINMYIQTLRNWSSTGRSEQRGDLDRFSSRPRLSLRTTWCQFYDAGSHGGAEDAEVVTPPHTLCESSASQWNKAPAQIGIVKLWVCLEMASGRLRQVREDGLLSSLTHYPSSLWGSCLFSIADRNLFFFRCFFDDGFMGLCISCKQKSALWLRIPLFNKKHTRCQATNTSDSFIVRGHQTAALLSMLLQKAGSLQTDISTKWQPTSFCNQQSVPKGLTWPHRRDWLSMMIATSQKILTASQTPQYHQNAATTH